MWPRLLLAGAVVAAIGLAPTIAEAATVRYTATITIPVPPASSFAGSAGGDGWALAMTPTAVYNVFHHNPNALDVACHKQVDATPCWATDSKVITDASANNFSGSSHPGLYLDQASGKLYIYSTRASDATAGVVCVDTTLPADNPNPFCGFVPLSAVGDGGITSIPMQVGSNWYAFNYVSGVSAGAGTGGTANTLLCFSLTTFAACASQPIEVSFGTSGAFQTGTFPVPATAAIGGKILVPTVVGGASIVGCFDPATSASCAGSWPITLGFGYIGAFGSAFPMLDAAGVTIGLCLPTGTDQCFNLAGASVTTPANMPAAITANSQWNGPAVVLGSRVYVPNGNTEQVMCFDYGTGASCPNFPHTLSNISLLYTVNPDPQRPSCLWVDGDSGAAQIQNFDAFSGGACGQGATRVLSGSFVIPTALCAPTQWLSLHVDSPLASQYTSGSVAFQDAGGNPIPGVSDLALDASGGVQLSGLALTSTLPQFLITFNGLVGDPGSVVITLAWEAGYDPSCVQGPVTATPPTEPTTTTIPAVTTTTQAPVPPTLPRTGSSSTPTSVAAGTLVLFGAGLLVVSRRRRTVH